MSRKYQFGRPVIVNNLLPAVVVIRGSSAGDSPRLEGSERGPQHGQGGAPEAETTDERPRTFAGIFILETLNGRGARYPEEKARRPGHGFCAIGSRILQEIEVSDSA